MCDEQRKDEFRKDKLYLIKCSDKHRDLYVLTHSFPTRRSSDLIGDSYFDIARLVKEVKKQGIGR